MQFRVPGVAKEGGQPQTAEKRGRTGEYKRKQSQTGEINTILNESIVNTVKTNNVCFDIYLFFCDASGLPFML